MINIGFCSGCEKQIWELHAKTKRPVRPLDSYQEFSMILSDETHARHSTCDECIDNLTDQKVRKIFNRIRAHWRLEMVGHATLDDFARLDTLEVISWALTEEEAIQKYYAKKEKLKRKSANV